MKTLKFIPSILLIWGLIGYSSSAFAHGDEKNGNKTEVAAEEHSSAEHQHDHTSSTADVHANAEMAEMHEIHEMDIVDAAFKDFSTIHPMVVHIPIMLVTLAFLLQIISLFIWQKQLNYITLALLTGGAIGAYLASGFSHPHTEGLSAAASQVLEKHELFATYTFWLSIVGVVLKSISTFLLKGKIWFEILIILCLAGAAFSVNKAAHYGATLIYIHGVGAQGNFIEMHSDNHEH